MGGAMLSGWLARGLDAKRVAVIEPNPSGEINALVTKGARLNPTPKEIGTVATLVIALKPQTFRDAGATLRSFTGPSTLVASIMAGTTIASTEAARRRRGRPAAGTRHKTSARDRRRLRRVAASLGRAFRHAAPERDLARRHHGRGARSADGTGWHAVAADPRRGRGDPALEGIGEVILPDRHPEVRATWRASKDEYARGPSF